MPPLRELQAAFAGALLGGPTEPAATQILEDGLRPQARLDIYRHHVFTTLTAALQATYPVICRLVDERFFAYAADRYIRTDPPVGACLFEYGNSFPEFLGGFEPSRHLRYLPDVARLEWALNAAIHTEDTTPMDWEVLRRLPVEALPRLTLRLDPSVSLVSSPWPIDHIWHVNQPDGDPGVTVDLSKGGACLEVRRIGDAATFRRIDEATHAFRAALAGGRCLEDAAAAALDVDATFDLAGALQGLFVERLPIDYAVAPIKMVDA